MRNRVDKQKRYRQKCALEGRCPHCGQPCAPYYECDERRAYKKSNTTLRYLVKLGILSCRRLPDGTNLYQHKEGGTPLKGRAKGYKIKANDIRYGPRVNKKFVNYSKIIDDIFKNNNRALSEDEIIEMITANIMQQKDADRLLRVIEN